ncbi:MAG: hypothetical protein D6785_06520 [Planctomycetota bacterium]|nr:MAG: hypothetical protein D6785_06520 [Planctomycetota bacterium]
MKKCLSMLGLFVLLVSLSGCGGFVGWGPMGHGSKVALQKKNFSVIQTNVTGDATVMVLFPFDLPFIGQMGLPLGEADLYAKAMKNLRSKIKNANQNVGLVNLTIDEKLKHFVVIGWKTVTITADVVQFQ